MTKKKKKRTPQQQPFGERTQVEMEPPIVVGRLMEGGPEENGRVWVGVETMHAAEISPGQKLLLSLAFQTPGEGNTDRSLVSAFAPPGLDADTFAQGPPVDLWQKWDLTCSESKNEMGMYYIGCEVWPNAKLNKGEMQVSGCLASCLGHPDVRSIFYLHFLKEKPLPCDVLALRWMGCVPRIGEERKDWLNKILADEGEMQVQVLRTLILQQLNGRLVLLQNVIPVLMLGCSVLFCVDALNSMNGTERVAVIDGDATRLQLDFKSKPESPSTEAENVRDIFLAEVSKHAGHEMEGSRKEAAIAGAREAALCGSQAAKRTDLESVVLSDAMSESLRSLVILPLTRPPVFTSMGVPPPCGVILYGPPGSGKTVCALWAAKASGAHLFVINGPSLISEYYGGSESALTGVFQSAVAVAPSLIFIDEMDAVTLSRGTGVRSLAEDSAQDSIVRLVTTLLSQFGALHGHAVVVLAATNRLEAIDEALRRPGRFDREIEMIPPTSDVRLTIFKSHLQRLTHSLNEEQVSELAFAAHGFVPADIAALTREASLYALRRVVSKNSPLTVEKLDFDQARSVTCPSGMRELQITVPRVKWDDVGGLEHVKQQLRESVEWPIKNALSLARIGVAAPKGVLLFGPPGCSKTLLAKAVATETGMNFISVSGSEILSRFVGQSEKAIVQLFARARLMAPCVVFLDEVDGLLGHRNGDDGTQLGHRMLAQILSEMDGIRKRGQVIVIGATNKPQLIDPAMLRPGRFDRLILVPPPDLDARRAIFDIQFRSLSVADDVKSLQLATMTENFTGADIAAVCRQAGIFALEEDLDTNAIHIRHFLTAVKATIPSIGNDEAAEMEVYESFQRGAV